MSRLSKHQIADLCVIVILFALSLGYFVNSYLASTHILNLIFIVPTTAIVLIFCILQFIKQLATPATIATKSDDRESLASVMPVIGLFTLYTITLEWAGFDVGTFLFIAAFLWVHGERRWQWIIGYSLSFALLTAIFFSQMLTYPLPMLILPTAY